MYLTFTQYREMGGKLDETAFSAYLRRAEAYINSRASGRTGERIRVLGEVPEAVAECAFELTELFSKQENRGIARIDRSVGGVSEAVSYNSASSAEADAEKDDVVSRCFYGAGLGSLLYLGGMI